MLDYFAHRKPGRCIEAVLRKSTSLSIFPSPSFLPPVPPRTCQQFARSANWADCLQSCSLLRGAHLRTSLTALGQNSEVKRARGWRAGVGREEENRGALREGERGRRGEGRRSARRRWERLFTGPGVLPICTQGALRSSVTRFPSTSREGK